MSRPHRAVVMSEHLRNNKSVQQIEIRQPDRVLPGEAPCRKIVESEAGQ